MKNQRVIDSKWANIASFAILDRSRRRTEAISLISPSWTVEALLVQADEKENIAVVIRLSFYVPSKRK